MIMYHILESGLYIIYADIFYKFFREHIAHSPKCRDPNFQTYKTQIIAGARK